MTEKPERERKKPGAPSESLKLHTSFEDAVSRILRAPVPPGGVPDREPTRKRRGSPKAPGELDVLRGTVTERGDVTGPTGEDWEADRE